MYQMTSRKWTMRASISALVFLLYGVLCEDQSIEKTTSPKSFFRNPLVESVINLFCGIAKADKNGEEPLVYSPWMVAITSVSEKGKDRVINCIGTLISGKHAITSEACLRRDKRMTFSVIIGAPSLEELHKGTKRNVYKTSVLLSDSRIAVLHFVSVIFSGTIIPACLERGDLLGVYATIGWRYKNESDISTHKFLPGRKVAFLELSKYCQIDGFCTEVLPVEDPWEMRAGEIQEGAPLLIRKNNDWYVKGIMIKENFEDEMNDDCGIEFQKPCRSEVETDSAPDSRPDVFFVKLTPDVFFVKLTSEVVDELRSMFVIFD